MDDTKRQIEQAIAGFVAAYNQRDADAVLSYYADDLVKLRHEAPVESKTETATRLRAVFASFTVSFSATTDEIIVADRIAVVRGSQQLHLISKRDGREQQIERRYMDLWRLDDGVWHIARSMDNVGYRVTS
jgi:ketosteroid isomerase-like protein